MKYVNILLILIICSCTKGYDPKLFIGELYFSEIRFGNYYNLDDSVRTRLEYAFDTTDFNKADSSQRNFIGLHHKFKAEGLLYKPFVDLRVNDSTFCKLYLDSSDYEKIKIYRWRYLLNRQKKVIIWGRTKEIGMLDVPLIYCTDLVAVELTDGQTFPGRQGKFRIDDYE